MSAAACKPNLNDTESLVTAPRILASRAGTEGGYAEATPMATLHYEALYAGASGDIVSNAITWAFCNERKPLAELGPVSPLCLQPSGDWLQAIGSGNLVMAAIPATACRQFGPDVPLPMSGQPPGRPVDPDTTGGYYQPVRILAPAASGSSLVAILEARLSCGLPNGSPPDVAAAFAQRYHFNTNPVVQSVGIKGAAAPWVPVSTSGSMPNAVVAGQKLTLEVTWAGCPLVDVPGDGVCGPDETGTACTSCGPAIAVSPGDCCPAMDCTQPTGCTGAERYVVFNRSSGGLVDEREGISVDWFATAGTFDADRTGRESTDVQSTSDNGWQAPARPGPAALWVVLRDDRGGVGWKEFALDVR